jgi:hypothetical protein
MVTADPGPPELAGARLDRIGKASGWTMARWSQPTPARLNSLEPASTVSGPKPRFCWRSRLSLSA